MSIMALMLIYFSFDVKDYTYNIPIFSAYLTLFLTYGIAAILYAYVLQRFFSISILAVIVIYAIMLFFGIILTTTTIILEIYMKTMVHIFVAFTLLVLLESNAASGLKRKWEMLTTRKLLTRERRSILANHHCEQLSLVVDEDDVDVIKEQKKVNRLEAKMNEIGMNPILMVKDLAKLAVKGVSFAVGEGECFGLLGLNGAGKTTCFGMLTGKISPGTGSVYIDGCSVASDNSPALSQIGYCPQFDALNMKLTAKENIIFYANIRGFLPDEIEPLVTQLLVSLNLNTYANTITSELSGGNRRKLSVAIALINQPKILLLDEASAGMDPGSQQFLWKVIEQLRRNGKTIVITSHSMEECEALCTRIAIMDQGKIRCIGSKQHLKNKFGEGYSLTVKLRNLSDVQHAADYLSNKINGIQLIHCCNMKQKWTIEDFALSQATLEDVFHTLAETSNQWYGHVLRQDPNQVARTAWNLELDGTRPRGRPKIRYIDIVKKDMTVAGHER
ncbi:hypothetical protein WR25_13280 [Diploscapter pachys]|uniref:ABC transporter domain-containing protein n=1 Tax=Diploscapter pachys TaxID=2018661 RepID=A0A2A2KZ14_9BILA|nr:hypothetical protein WR25_13280 [Diploscapter pachys]